MVRRGWGKWRGDEREGCEKEGASWPGADVGSGFLARARCIQIRARLHWIPSPRHAMPSTRGFGASIVRVLDPSPPLVPGPD